MERERVKYLRAREPREGDSNWIDPAEGKAEVDNWAPPYTPENWTVEQAMLLEPFFSNLDGPVFVIKNMPEEVVAAISSRVSRAEPSIRMVFWNEYIKPIVGPRLADAQGLFEMSEVMAADDMWEAIQTLREGGMEKVANSERARKFFQTWLAQYGDDSIAEMANLHLGIEGISQIAVKEVEDVRIGVSPIEKSSRYVKFGEPNKDGKYQYVSPIEILEASVDRGLESGDDTWALDDDFVVAVNILYETYVDQNVPLVERLRTLFPKGENESRTAWNSTLRAKAFDVLRVYLVGGTQTTVAISANARALEGLVNRLYASSLGENRWLGRQIHQEVRKVTPSLMERPGTARGQQQQIYLENLDRLSQDTLADLMDAHTDLETDREQPAVELLDVEDEETAQINLVAQLLYKKSQGHTLRQLREIVGAESSEWRAAVIKKYLDERKVRQNKVPRAFEEVTYKFELTGNFGIYRDLQRHRMNTTERQLFTDNLGFDVPQDIVDAGLEEEFNRLMQEMVKLDQDLADAGVQAEARQYGVPYASNVRWSVKLSLRELYWIVELRTGPQGHPDYRKMVQEMFRQVAAVHPSLVAGMRVDTNDYDLARRESESRIEKKLAGVNGGLTGEVKLD